MDIPSKYKCSCKLSKDYTYLDARVYIRTRRIREKKSWHRKGLVSLSLSSCSLEWVYLETWRSETKAVKRGFQVAVSGGSGHPVVDVWPSSSHRPAFLEFLQWCFERLLLCCSILNDSMTFETCIKYLLICSKHE